MSIWSDIFIDVCSKVTLKNIVHKIYFILTFVYCPTKLSNAMTLADSFICQKKVFTVHVLVVINVCDSACQLPHAVGHHARTASCCGSRRGSSRGQPTLSHQN